MSDMVRLWGRMVRRGPESLHHGEMKRRRYYSLVALLIFATSTSLVSFVRSISQSQTFRVSLDLDNGSVASAPQETTTISTASWQPSFEWVQTCIKDLEIAQPPQPFQVVWRRYVLGDCIKMCRKCYVLKCVRHPEKAQQRGSGCFEQATRNDTFAALYHFRACKTQHHVEDGNWTIVDEIMKEAERKDSSFVPPNPDALVIHLRLGDVIENSNSSVEDMLMKGGDPWHIAAYQSAIKSIHEYLSDIASTAASEIIIRGGSHDPNYYYKSRLYAGCLHRAILAAGYNATISLEGMDPDHDFFFMSHAKQIIVSAGGYSRLMGTFAKRNGGRVVGREFHEQTTESET